MTKIFVFLSLLSPFLFFGFDHDIPSFIPFKYLFILLSIISVVIEKRKVNKLAIKIVVLMLFKLTMALSLGVDYYRALMAFHVLGTPFIYWVIFSSLSFKEKIWVFLYLSMVEIVYGLLIFGTSPWQNRAALIGGHFTVIYVILANRHWLLGMTSVFSSSIRFAVIYVVLSVRRFGFKRLSVLALFGSLLLPYILLFGGTEGRFYSASAGYRAFEYIVMWSYLVDWNWLIGKSFGSTNGMLEIGSKGLVEHYGIFHNYWISIVVNLGLAALYPLKILWNKLFETGQLNIVVAVIMVMMVFDSPRDGQWFLGLVLSMSKHENYFYPSRLSTSV